MAYKKYTTFFHIPIPCKGDKIQEAEETKARNIIENQLIAGMKGFSCAVFEEGAYKLLNNQDGTYSVSLVQTMGNFAFCGIVGGCYAESKDPILWNNLQVGYQYYLYLQYADAQLEDPTAFRLTSSRTPIGVENGPYLLMATLNLTNEQHDINSEPDGKIYSDTLATHHTNNVNPHGTLLIQDDLTVNQKLTVANIESTSELSLKDKRTTVALSDDSNTALTTKSTSIIGAINELVGDKTAYMEVESGGQNGVLLTVPDANAIDFVSAIRLALDGSLGDIAFGFWQQDNSVPNKSTFKMYNSDELGIKLRLQIFYK